MKKILLPLFLTIFIFSTISVQAQRVMEKLNRGLVAVRTSSTQVFVSWRALGYDADNVAFNLYRDNIKLNSVPITGATNYTDANSVSSVYTVKTVVNNVETGEQDTSSVWANTYMDIPMNIPASMTMPDASVCTYSPNDCSAGDVDGDGEYEIVVKWDPSNSKDNSFSGYTGDVYIDVYKLNGTQLCRIDLGKNIRAGAHYTDFEVEDFDGDGKAEIICKTAPGTVDGLGKFLSKGPAANDNDAADYRNAGGYILSGPEYLTVFSGLTGAELATANYNPARGTVSSWGDSYGNRVDRFLACSAYLDGIHPSVIMCRGYYTRAVLAAWDFRNGTLTQRWVYDSNSPNGVSAYGQGNHNLSVGDIDNDGKDEIVYGASAFDDDGKCLYSTGLGHGDAMHLSDLDPERKGLEVWEVHEGTGAAYGEEMHDAKTGAVLWGVFTGSDNGRGCAANLIPGNRGFEMWSASGAGVFSKSGVNLNSSKPSMNFRIYWDGDLQDELLDNITISKYGVGSLLSATNCSSNNGTKATPNLSADILGDWREELILRSSDNTKLRVFTSPIPTTYKMYTLMHDAVYRNAIAWQNTGYNQPPHAGFYIGDDMDGVPVSPAYNNEKRWKGGLIWDNNITASWKDSLDQVSTFKNGDGVVFDISAGANAAITLTGVLEPKRLVYNSSYKVELSGTGNLNGNMELKKTGAGTLKLNNINNFTGATTLYDGEFYNNGTLTNSEVFVKSFVKFGGAGVYGNHVTLSNTTTLAPGNTTGEIAKITFQNDLKELGAVTYMLDMTIANGVVSANDTIIINGNWTMSGKSAVVLNIINGTLPAGNYKLMHCGGTITGDITKIKFTGIPSYLNYVLQNNGGDIYLKVEAPAMLTWKASVDGKWDTGKTANWVLSGINKTFSTNDSVLFNDEAILKAVVINESISPASILMENTTDYTFSGTGSIDGASKLTKKGTGKLSISSANKYTGKTIINEGTLEIATITNGGVASPVGAATNASANIEINGGKLNYTGSTITVDRGLTIGANGGTIGVSSPIATLTTSGKIVGTGKLIKDGTGKLAVSAANTYTGGTIIKAGIIGLTTDAANSSGLGNDTITFQGGTLSMFESNSTINTSVWNLNIPTGFSGTLMTDGNSVINGSITGGGTLNYYSNYTSNILASNLSMYTGTISVTTDADGGLFLISNLKGCERAKVNLTNKVTMMYYNTATTTIKIGDLTGLVNSILGAGGTSACTVTWEIGERSANSVFNGKITDTQYSGTGAVAAISKVGTGTWTLTNANTFTGGTEINSGTLMVNNTTGSGLGTGETSVYTDATLAGSGIISGSLRIADGGTLAPGNGVGTFTVNNNVNVLAGGSLSIEIDKTNAKNDLLNCIGTFNIEGKLEVEALNMTAFVVGDSFKIINGTITGTPTEIIPAFPGDGLEWDLSEFNTTGTLKVKAYTGIKALEMNSDIYPIPCKNNLNIRLNENADNLQISLYNLVGNEVYGNSYNSQSEIQLNLSNLPKGIYMLHMTAENKSYTRKIVKE